MQIYESEKQDGLESKLASASFGLLSDPILYTPTEEERFTYLIAEANPNQLDLYYLKSILVSVGWNKNDDVFPPEDTWNARNTPVDKPFNYMHDQKDIIGHITSANVVSEGIVIEGPDIPQNFDIVVGSVLYRKWADKDLKERMDKLIAEIQEGKWKVSMECLFSNFDYAIISSQGENRVVRRNESSAFLTKHLRVYGGTGEYEGYKIGRLLRDFTFSGKGLVDKPANPRSDVIGYSDKEETKIFVGAVEASVLDLQREEEIMTDTVYTKEQYESLQEELNSVKSKLDEAIKQKDSVIADLSKQITDIQTVRDDVIKEKDEQITALTQKVKESDGKLIAIQAEMTKNARLARVLERVDEEKAKSLVEKFAGASDEMFNELVEALPIKEDVSPEDIAKAQDVVDNIDSANVEPIGSVNTEDTEKTLLQSVSSWLGDNLRSTARLKKE